LERRPPVKYKISGQRQPVASGEAKGNKPPVEVVTVVTATVS